MAIHQLFFNRKVLFIYLICCSVLSAQAQLQMDKNGFDGSNLTRSLLPVSPAAASIARYGDAQVNFFTGTPAIDIPLYNLAYKELQVGLNLSYQHGNGVKPGMLPGPVGNGWGLSNGGVITRLSKGIVPVAFPNSMIVETIFNYTSYSDWSSDTKMKTNISTPVYLTNQNCQYDEFYYSFGGLSGKFYTDYNGVQHFKSAQGEDLKIEMQVLESKKIKMPTEDQLPPNAGNSQGQYKDTVNLQQFPYKFIITDSKGVKYTFGGNDSSIELSRQGRALQPTPSSVFIDDNLNKNTEPVSWYLTSIKSPDGYEITLTYQRDKFYVTKNSYCKGLFTQFSSDAGYNWNTGYPTARLITSTMINPCYLQKITTPSSRIQFYWSTAGQQLGYKYKADIDYPATNPSVYFDTAWHPDQQWCDIYYYYYPDVNRASIDNRFPNKLDYFTVLDSISNKVTKTVSFNYTNDTTTRLKLTSVAIKGSTNDSATAQTYSFQYNSLALPHYLEFKTDGYGYSNGQNPYMTTNNPTTMYNNWNDSNWRNSYIASRAVDTNYSRAEILQRVTYPTGGYTVYEYENNNYSRVTQSWPSGYVNNAGNANLLTGGVRIKKISNFDYDNHKVGEKKYYYVRGYATGGQTSSGVLSYVPTFWEKFGVGHITAAYRYRKVPADSTYHSGNLQYQNWGSDPINPMSVNKSTYIGYSEVAEVNEDSSYTVYKFKNYDNGYQDQPALKAIYDHQTVSSTWKEDDENSLELERGQILSQEIYDANDSLKRSVINEYYNDSIRLTDNGTNIRMLKCYGNPIMSSDFGMSLRYLATLAYTYYPYLKKQTQTDYTQPGTSIVTETTFTYDTTYRVLKEQSITGSDGIVKKVVNTYPSHRVAVADTIPYKTMVKKHIVSPVIESSVYVNNTFLQASKTSYGFWGASGWTTDTSGFIKSKYEETKNRIDTTYKRRMNYHAFDTSGNLILTSLENNIKTAYIWGYRNQFPIAQCVNADSTGVAYTSFEAGDKGNWTFTGSTTTHPSALTGLKGYSLSGGNITRSGLSSGATYTITYWIRDSAGSVTVNSGSGTLLNTKNGWKLYSHQVTGSTSITVAGTAYIDELRLYPSAALMTTYTYDPLIGMTTQCDPNSRITFYEYDAFGRLKITRDQDKNIIKKVEYKYKAIQ